MQPATPDTTQGILHQPMPFGMHLRVPPRTAVWAFAPAIVREAPDNEAVVVRLQDGVLRVFYIAQPDRTELHSIESADGGLTWTDGKKEFSLPGKAYHAIQILLDREGELHAVFHILNEGPRGYRGRHSNLWHARTGGGRKCWGPAKQFFDGYVGAIRGIVQMRNGRILVPVGVAIPERESAPAQGQDDYGWNDVAIFYSDDSGSHWDEAPQRLKVLQNTDRARTRYGAIEPHVVEFADGRLWMLIRTKNGYLYESFSGDGKNWTDPVPSTFISSDSPAASAKLSNGSIVVFFNANQRWDDVGGRIYGGREVLQAAISSDLGRTWKGFREVLHERLNDYRRGDRGAAYPSATVTAEGKILLTSGQGERIKAIVLFDPEWLTETVQKEDFSNGLMQWTMYGSKGPALIKEGDVPMLRIERTDSDLRAGAAWNFPAGHSGQLTLQVRVGRAFGGMNLVLNDHFSVISDTLTEKNAVYSMDIQKADGMFRLIEPGRWQEVVVEWGGERAKLSIDGHRALAFEAQRKSQHGVFYLRLTSTAASAAAGTGFDVRSISVMVQ